MAHIQKLCTLSPPPTLLAVLSMHLIFLVQCYGSRMSNMLILIFPVTCSSSALDSPTHVHKRWPQHYVPVTLNVVCPFLVISGSYSSTYIIWNNWICLWHLAWLVVSHILVIVGVNLIYWSYSMYYSLPKRQESTIFTLLILSQCCAI